MSNTDRAIEDRMRCVCDSAVNRVKKVKIMKYGFTLCIRDSVFCSQSTYCEIVGEQARRIAQHSDAQQHSYNTSQRTQYTRLITTWRQTNEWMCWSLCFECASAISSAISSMRWERNARHFRRFIWPRFAYNIERNTLSFRVHKQHEAADDLKNVAFIALAVVLIFVFIFFYYMGTQDMYFFIFIFFFSFCSLNKSLLVCWK